MLDTPVLFLIFNRPETTALVFSAIRAARPKRLYVAADGPRDQIPDEGDVCRATRAVLENVDWSCEVTTLFRDRNLGCRKAISEALSWFFKHEEEGIILEDDCLPDPTFFPYCQKLLSTYRDDKRVFSINGSNFGYRLPGEASYGYTRFMNMWGWATWRRSERLVDYEMNLWRRMGVFRKYQFLTSRLGRHFTKEYDYGWTLHWIEKFDRTARCEINTWDYQWIFTALTHRAFSIFPRSNLVRNLGFTPDGTHTQSIDPYLSDLKVEPVTIPLNGPKNFTINQDFENSYVKSKWAYYHFHPLYFQIIYQIRNKLTEWNLLSK